MTLRLIHGTMPHEVELLPVWDAVCLALDLTADSALNDVAVEVILYCAISDSLDEAIEWAEGHYSRFGRQVAQVAWREQEIE